MAINTKSNPRQGGCTSLTPLPLIVVLVIVVLAAVDAFSLAVVTGGAVVGSALHEFSVQQTELQELTE